MSSPLQRRPADRLVHNPAPVAFVLKGYPRLSETFIAQEIRALEQAGLNIVIYSLRPPRESVKHPIHARIKAPVVYLPERLRDGPGRIWAAVLRRLLKPSGWRALAKLLRDLRDDPSADRFLRFGQAAVLAELLPDSIKLIHAHFLHSPASVARYAATMAHRRWSCSAHAKDIWTLGAAEKSRKLNEASWTVTCTAGGRQHLAALSSRPDDVLLAYHGLDLTHFPAPPTRSMMPDGSQPDEPITLLSVGRAVRKKGFDVLLEALARLPRDLHWRWVHIGAGDETANLREQAATLDLSDHIDLRGPRTQADVLAAYRAADIFVLPSRVAPDGDRDGLPNVLMEAMSQELACISAPISGIPELITDDQDGKLVASEAPDALAACLTALITEPETRRRLGLAGRRTVQERFSPDTGITLLCERFGIEAARAHTDAGVSSADQQASA